jgi:hypothetical protein
MGFKYTKKPKGSTILQSQPNRPHHAPATMSSEKNDTPEKPDVPSLPGNLEGEGEGEGQGEGGLSASARIEVKLDGEAASYR